VRRIEEEYQELMKDFTIIYHTGLPRPRSGSPLLPFLPLLLCAGLFLTGCGREEPLANLDMPVTPVFAIRAHWGVVVSPYLRVRSRPQSGAEVVAHLRNSSIVEILAKTSYPENVEEKSDYWYEISCDGIRGWVFGSYLDFHSSRQEAEQAAQRIVPPA
jgi:hypothetical protein